MLNRIEVTNALENINTFIKEKGIEAQLTYRAEVSHLIRAGRSQISLNVSQTGAKLIIEIINGKRKITGECSGDIVKSIEDFKSFILKLNEKIEFMPEVAHLTPINKITQADIINEKFDQKLVEFESKDIVDFYKEIVQEFESLGAEVSGAFSAGAHSYAVINTKVEKAIFYKGTDWNAEVVLQLVNDSKKEIRASAVGEMLKDFDSNELKEELRLMLNYKRETERADLKAGEYNIIFSSDAFAELTAFLGWVSLSGEAYEYEAGMLQKGKDAIGDKLFGENITITDNPSDPEVLFARHIGHNGVQRKQFPLIRNGVLEQMFYSDKDTCDRFSLNINNDESVASIKVHAGSGPSELKEIIRKTTDKTIYIPYIHYMNITNAAKGEFTGTSRFGTLMMENGEVTSHLYNLRINDSLRDMFNNIEWLSERLQHVNTSDTYDMRSSSAITCPKFVQINKVKITGSSAV